MTATIYPALTELTSTEPKQFLSMITLALFTRLAGNILSQGHLTGIPLGHNPLNLKNAKVSCFCTLGAKSTNDLYI